jgi:hypothetical protein
MPLIGFQSGREKGHVKKFKGFFLQNSKKFDITRISRPGFPGHLAPQFLEWVSGSRKHEPGQVRLARMIIGSTNKGIIAGMTIGFFGCREFSCHEFRVFLWRGK